MTDDVPCYDLLVIGAGLSGIGAAVRFKQAFPHKSLAILEAREDIGGTWDLFRYPGVRSDSDMFTLGYPFAPWRGEHAIADGRDILQYLRDTADRFRVRDHIRFAQQVVQAQWSTALHRWLVETRQHASGQTFQYSCKFLYFCTGYYQYRAGYQPSFVDQDAFGGTMIHPQHWPNALDVKDKRIVLIGSGATAMTLAPSLARRGAHVTMLQRSPTYVISRPARDKSAQLLGAVLPNAWAGPLNQMRMAALTALLYQFARRFPKLSRRALLARVRAQLPKDYLVDEHFGPHYAPWDQRLCVVLEGDLFREIRNGRLEIVTDTIARFTPAGVETSSGRLLSADIIVTATGLELVPFGDTRIIVDDQCINPANHVFYKAIMLSGLPNLAVCAGYVNASWTLRADLSSRWLCRLIAWMDKHDMEVATPVLPSVAAEHTEPAFNLSSGYLKRAAGTHPKQGLRYPWSVRQNYFMDWPTMRLRQVDGPDLSFEPNKSHIEPAEPPQIAAGG